MTYVKDYFSVKVSADEEANLIVIHIECDKKRFGPMMDLMLSGAETFKKTAIRAGQEATKEQAPPS